MKIQHTILITLLTLTIFLNLNFVLAENKFEEISGLKKTGSETGHFETKISKEGLLPTISKIVQVILGFVGIFFLCLSIYGGFVWMTSQGNNADIEKAQKIIQNAVIGLAIVLGAYAITYSIYAYLLK